MTFCSPKILKNLFPLATCAKFVAESRKTAMDIVEGVDPRLAIIVGPCSIHNIKSAKEYGLRLLELSKQVREHCFLVMRVYMEKPRTMLGWKGFLYDPHLDGSNDIETGLKWSRELFLDLSIMGIPIATEFLDPLAMPYLEDLTTWGFIGARTTTSQPHRQMASFFSFPTGFKNTLDGNLDYAVQGALTAQFPHTFLALNDDGHVFVRKSKGNLFSHIVLRGSQDKTNYDPTSIRIALQKLKNTSLFPRLLIDCSHGNCQRDYKKQETVFHSILQFMETDPSSIMGMMVESNLEAGQQLLIEDLSQLDPSISITDPCISWETTEALILETYKRKSFFKR